MNMVAQWHLQGVYPAKWTGPSMDAMGSGAVATESLVLAHSGFAAPGEFYV
jgi:hypothetical protein